MRLGDGDLGDEAGIQFRSIHKRELHPKYQWGQPYFDVAMLTLDSRANISGQFVRPVCLPYYDSETIDDFVGDDMEAAGTV